MNGPYVSGITLINGESFEFEANDVVIFVGSNNCGKSTTLKEIDALYQNNNQNAGHKLISSITIGNDMNDDVLKEKIKNNSHIKAINGINHYQGIGYNINSNLFDDRFDLWKSNTSNYHKVFTTMLSTDNRLRLVNKKSDKEDGADAPSEVYHIYSDDSSKFFILKQLFEKVFGTKLFFYPQFHNRNLDFKVSEEGLYECLYNDGNFGAYKKKYNDAESIEGQGDGMKSFTGITAELISGDKNTYIIDEPESFLHPPQANILGQEIGDLTEGQIFLATHSQDFIKGVLKSNSERVKILRIVRHNDNTTEFKHIDKQDLTSIQEDPFLHYSNYLDSLFNHYTIICEDSTDCIFYNKIFDIILEEQGKENLSLNYIYTGGKNNFAKVYELSHKLGIQFFIIGDIDLLNTWSLLERIFGKKVKSIKGNRKKLKKKVEGFGNTTMLGMELKTQIDEMFDNGREITKNDKSKIITIFNKLKKPRDNLKQKGEGVYGGRKPKYYTEMIESLEARGVFLVPVGEIENFIPSIKSKKKNFVNEALKTDSNSRKLVKVKKFINKIVSHF